MNESSLRRDWVSRPIFRWARKVLPSLSATEREAIEAGDVWWDADLFSGNPDWAKLLATPPAKLSAEEQAFLDGPVEDLCGMIDDWAIIWELRDLPPNVWDFLKAHRFFEFEWQGVVHRSVRLDFWCMLMKARLRVHPIRVLRASLFFRHNKSPFFRVTD